MRIRSRMYRLGAVRHPLCMGLLRNVWAGRPFWSKKLGQLGRLVWESHARPVAGEPGVPLVARDGELSAMFLGHSSFLLGLGGRQVLVDPVFATRLVLLRRQRRVGVRWRDLPPIDVVLLTHAHMDHLNRPTLRRIARRTRCQTGTAPVVVVPRGVEDLVADLGFSEVRVLSEWWAATEVAGLQVTLTPARHWGARMFKDTHRLFGGYVVADPAGSTVYHSGDTAYFAGFREIGERLGPIGLALLPIGAYFPDSHRGVHTNPEEALRGFLDCGAQWMVPMHFGTFRLGREPMAEPPVRLLAEAVRLGVADRVRVLTEGETLVVRLDEEAGRREDAGGVKRVQGEQVGVAGDSKGGLRGESEREELVVFGVATEGDL